MSNYNPKIPPTDETDLLPYLSDEFARVSISLNDLNDGSWEINATIPDKVKPGLVRLFNGTTANPLGSGQAGLYYYGSDSAWHYIGGVQSQPTGWATPTLSNGWTAAGPVAYRRDGNGVDFTFTITGGTITDGTLLFTLPAGFRPALSQRHLIGATIASTSPSSLLISPSGTVQIYFVPAGTATLFGTIRIPL